MNLKRELFKEMLIRDSFVPPVQDEFDIMAKQAAQPMTETTKNVVLNSLPWVSAGLLTAGALTGVNKLMNVKKERKEENLRNDGFKEVLTLYPQLKERSVDQGRLRKAYDAYMEFSPTSAKHPLIIGQMLSSYGPDSAVNVQTLKDMAAAESSKATADDKRKSSFVDSSFRPIGGVPAMKDIVGD